MWEGKFFLTATKFSLAENFSQKLATLVWTVQNCTVYSIIKKDPNLNLDVYKI
jgi:hypothetical protein